MMEVLSVEFDESKRVLHLAANQPTEISTMEQLIGMCRMVHEVVSQYGPERLYLIVDITNIAIDPKLNEAYGHKISGIAEKFLFPGGIARYGYQITRVTIEMGLAEDEKHIDGMFDSRAAAEAYIDGLINKCENESTPTPTPPGSP
jgi:hypothetical protein